MGHEMVLTPPPPLTGHTHTHKVTVSDMQLASLTLLVQTAAVPLGVIICAVFQECSVKTSEPSEVSESANGTPLEEVMGESRKNAGQRSTRTKPGEL